MVNNQPVQPQITVVVPVLNRVQFIEATLRSILDQPYPHLACIVMDGGSRDGTVEIIQRFADRLAYWESAPDDGQAAAINKGLALAQGDILTWLNADDMWLPQTISRLITVVQQQPEAVAWVGGCRRLTSAGRLLNTIWPQELTPSGLANWNTNYFYQPACFFAAWGWRQTGQLGTPSYQYAFDVDLWLQLVRYGQFASVPHVLAEAVIHPAAKTQSQRDAMHAEIITILQRHHFSAAAQHYQHRRRWRRVFHILALAQSLKG